MTSDKQTESQPVQQNNDPKPHRTLTDAGIEELISFFQLLAKWDRETKSKSLSETGFRKPFDLPKLLRR
jgi:hypothetical protein